MTSGVLKFSRSWRSLIPSLFLGSILLLIGLYATAYYDASILSVPFIIGDTEYSLRLPVFLLIFLFVLIRPLVSLYDCYYEVSAHHLRIVKGRMSFRYNKQEFAFEDLMGVHVSQSLLERLFGVGNIQVGSRSTMLNLKLNGVGSPEYYAKEISNRIDNARVEERTGSKG